MGTWQLSPRGNEAAAALYGGSYGTCTTRHRTIPYEPPYITLRAAVRYIIVRYRTCRRTWTYEASYSAVRVAVRRRTSRRMAPYEASYDTVRAAVRLRTMCRTVPYGGSYGAVRRLVRSYCDDLDLYPLVTLLTSYTGTRFGPPCQIGMITLGVLVWLCLFSVKRRSTDIHARIHQEFVY